MGRWRCLSVAALPCRSSPRRNTVRVSSKRVSRALSHSLALVARTGPASEGGASSCECAAVPNPLPVQYTQVVCGLCTPLVLPPPLQIPLSPPLSFLPLSLLPSPIMASASISPAPVSFVSGGKEFFTFPSFEATHRLEKIKKLAPDVCANAEWVAVEKVHGSNFSVTFGEGSDEGVFASRSNYLAQGFFNHPVSQQRTGSSPTLDQITTNADLDLLLTPCAHCALCSLSQVVMKPYMPAISALVADIRSAKPGVRVQCFGELFGGAVQTVNVVFYSPVPDFRAFDLFVAGEPMAGDEFRALCAKHSVPYLKVMARGKLDELLALNPAFESELHKDLGHALPADFKSNKAEGFVLSPAVPVTVSVDGEPTRVMIKHKNPSHSEVTVKQVKPAKAPPANAGLPAFDTLSADVQALVTKARGFVTLNRLGNYLSKVGAYDPALQAKTASGLVQDAITDLQKEVDPAEKLILAKQQKVLRGYMALEAQAVIDEYVASLKK